MTLERPVVAWLLTDGKAGDEVPCLGLAHAMHLQPERRLVRPRALYAAWAPRGPADPRDSIPLTPPYPAIAFASGRRTVPYLRALKQRSPATFTVFLKDPRIGASVADLVWVAAHDALRGRNVLVSQIAPHTLSPDALGRAREGCDPRVAALPRPRAAVLLGGPSSHHRYGRREADGLVAAIAAMRRQNFSVGVTASRRTPDDLVAHLRERFANDARVLVWAGEGANPYAALLATADAVLVSADSTNMIGEALATGVPVHIFEPSGGHPKLRALIDGLIAEDRVQRWRGRLETWATTPSDPTAALAGEVAVRFAAFQQGHAQLIGAATPSR